MEVVTRASSGEGHPGLWWTPPGRGKMAAPLCPVGVDGRMGLSREASAEPLMAFRLRSVLRPTSPRGGACAAGSVRPSRCVVTDPNDGD
jgi:hypothetical protein